MRVCETCGALGGAHKTSCTGPVMNEIGKPSVQYRRPESLLEPLRPPMHFMRGSLAHMLPELISTIPGGSDITITETTAQDGKKALTITATWNEDQ